MVIVANGPVTISKGVRTLLFDASVLSLLPGLFAGKIRPQSIPLATDYVLIELVGKTTGNEAEDTEVFKLLTNDDLHFYLTPLQSFGAYKIYATLQNTSTSATIPLDFEISRAVV